MRLGKLQQNISTLGELSTRGRGYAIHYMRASSTEAGEITAGAKGQTARGGYRSVRGRSFEGRV
jgi:hypothetical protein